ncbi:OLC1v1005786C1 [Oldenlandia corymbosa var. corymbosa]|uniref:OLC1v1005786C1 n=1 Tax=Oldenlandia corymbosa var. corymbosa TaxID=529605 RepID=A0AAV1DFH5_OLDCO|nr:OLC1v1005786C1 [Oldenlandia corymbosa var. corymbosa]
MGSRFGVLQEVIERSFEQNSEFHVGKSSPGGDTGGSKGEEKRHENTGMRDEWRVVEKATEEVVNVEELSIQNEVEKMAEDGGEVEVDEVEVRGERLVQDERSEMSSTPGDEYGNGWNDLFAG